MDRDSDGRESPWAEHGGDGEHPGTGFAPVRTRVLTPVLVVVGLLAAAATGYFVGRTRSASYPCGSGAVAVVDVSGLPEETVEVHVPLRAGFSNALLPLEAALPVLTLGSRVAHQGFRASEGRLVLLVRMPRDAIGMGFEVVAPADGRVLASGRLPLAPGCRPEPA